MRIHILVLPIFVLFNWALHSVNRCGVREGSQYRLYETKDVKYNGIEIYTNRFTPDKCNYGEWSKGHFPAGYTRTMHYKGFIATSTDPDANETPIMTLERLMEIVRKSAKGIGANLICGGKIEKSLYESTNSSNQYTYEFHGTALYSKGDKSQNLKRITFISCALVLMYYNVLF